jgi:hypothetical protein
MSAAVERQLEQFQTDHDGAEHNEKPSASGTDLVLYRYGPILDNICCFALNKMVYICS